MHSRKEYSRTPNICKANEENVSLSTTSSSPTLLFLSEPKTFHSFVFYSLILSLFQLRDNERQDTLSLYDVERWNLTIKVKFLLFFWVNYFLLSFGFHGTYVKLFFLFWAHGSLVILNWNQWLLSLKCHIEQEPTQNTENWMVFTYGRVYMNQMWNSLSINLIV